MKLSINGKEVDLVVNGEVQTSVIRKAKLADKNMSPNEIVRKAREAKEALDKASEAVDSE